MAYSFKFVRTVNGKTIEEKYPDNQSSHCAMGVYAGKHNLNIKCVLGRFGELSKSVMYKGDDSQFGVCGYVCWDKKETRGRIRDILAPKPKLKKKRSS